MPGLRAHYPDRRHTLFSLWELVVTRESEHLTTLSSVRDWNILSQACRAYPAFSSSDTQNQSCPGCRNPRTAVVGRCHAHQCPCPPCTRLADEHVGTPRATRCHLSHRHGRRSL